AIFAAAFWLLAINRFAFIFTEEANEERSYVSVIRPVAFVLILIAIVDQNRSRQINPCGKHSGRMSVFTVAVAGSSLLASPHVDFDRTPYCGGSRSVNHVRSGAPLHVLYSIFIGLLFGVARLSPDL